MRILLTPIGSAGDNLPFVGLGGELTRRGHEVTIATAEPFADAAERSGLNFISLVSGTEYRAAIEDGALFHPMKGYAAVMNLVCEYNRRLFDVVAAKASQGPLAVVAHSLDFASGMLAEKTGLPVVRVHLQPAMLRTSYRVPVTAGTTNYSFLPRWTKRALWSLVDRILLDPPIAPALNELRARIGLPRVRRVFATQLESPLLTLAMFPEWFAPWQPDWPASLRLCDFPLFDGAAPTGGSAEIERFLNDGPPPIVFTPGSAMRFGHAFFAAAAGACGRLGRRGLLLTPHSEQVPASLPAGTARFDYAPLGAILPRCAAVVHHGGIGTTAAALAAGVPQLIVPFSHDQPDNADRVLRLGVGRRIMPRQLGVERAASELRALLGSEETAGCCARIAARLSPNQGIDQACDMIEAALTAEISRTPHSLRRAAEPI